VVGSTSPSMAHPGVMDLITTPRDRQYLRGAETGDAPGQAQHAGEG
jgi:hypothetical protein